ncbi:MAG: hypothetical protein IJA78_02480 [Clostridia bacterium]|nr:hypothetical protein [Clostridia bacterium]
MLHQAKRPPKGGLFAWWSIGVGEILRKMQNGRLASKAKAKNALFARFYKGLMQFEASSSSRAALARACGVLNPRLLQKSTKLFFCT